MGKNSNDQSSASPEHEEVKKAGAFSLSTTPVDGEPEPMPLDVHKFEIAPDPAPEPETPFELPEIPSFEDLGTLPATYLEDTLFLVARDPRWLFAYWDFDWTKFPAAAMRGGHAQYFLKITKANGVQETIVEITPEARNWYVPVSSPDALYFAELGFFARDGGWVPIITSGVAKTPPDALAEDAAIEFATVPAHLSFDRLLTLVRQQMEEGETLLEAVARITDEGRKLAFRAGQAPNWNEEQRALLAVLLGHSLIDRIGLGSEEIDQLLRKQLLETLQSESAGAFRGDLSTIFAPGESSLFSAIGASWSAQPFSVKRERGFYLHVNAEIIFYGGTHPDATVWVDGNAIELSADGTFRYHFTLPDGDFSVPIVARSPDGVETRSASLSFKRGTAKEGEVGNTGQPPYLSPLIGRK